MHMHNEHINGLRITHSSMDSSYEHGPPFRVTIASEVSIHLLNGMSIKGGVSFQLICWRSVLIVHGPIQRLFVSYRIRWIFTLFVN